MTDIENKLNSASHATATASGGKKALIGNAVYVSKRDAASGKMSYTKIEAVNRHVTKETTYYDDRVIIEYKNKKGDTLDSSADISMSRKTPEKMLTAAVQSAMAPVQERHTPKMTQNIIPIINAILPTVW